MSMGVAVFAFLCHCFVLMLSLRESSGSQDILGPSLSVRDGESLVSARGKFELAFFSDGSSKNWYLGIWYYKMNPRTIVWVANRDNPLNDSSGTLKIGDDGNLILLDRMERVAWSTSAQNISTNRTVAQLLDSGNLVLRDESKTEGNLWQSFDHPSDTLLAGMKLGFNRYLTSWKSSNDPSPGQFTYSVNGYELPQLVIREGSVNKFRSGPWNGVGFSGIPTIPNLVFNPRTVVTSGEMFYDYGLGNESTTTRSVISYSGEVQRYVWSSSLGWLLIYTLPSDPCDVYGKCGSDGVCTMSNTRICSCLPGYIPKFSQDWEMNVWSGGCVQKHILNCSKGEGFKELKGVKVPDFPNFWISTSVTLKDCEAECLKNCSCTAYANSNVSGKGSGCLLWYGDLVDVRQFARSGNQNLYVRVSASDLGSKNEKQLVAVTVSVSVTVVILFAAFLIIWRRRKKAQDYSFRHVNHEILDLTFPIPSFVALNRKQLCFHHCSVLASYFTATIGQLPTGQQIAVKRLSKDSKQGPEEFKNEVILIAKLQHRNLVRLLGCCTEGEERMLIYEYMPNRSLNSYIFDGTRNSLVWRRRFNIIVGIARGLLYLHRDSRLTIIHRDLKASNVLLDHEMNPKISDFGIARAFGGDQISEKTRRVIGTYGYMSPEYIMDGLFSMKSDVYSFGVLVLEIVSGKRNRMFYHPDHDLNLLGHAWKLWTEGNPLELLEQVKEEDQLPLSEVLKCLQVGLLCVQRRPEDRPTMASALLMLDGESVMLPQPKQPGFYSEGILDEAQYPLARRLISTSNEATISLLEGRTSKDSSIDAIVSGLSPNQLDMDDYRFIKVPYDC
ncbi:LOW QUALITY PROTEIN: hypothetical protein RJ640_017550 [Escallonia rubra]|uniref:Receptor-like serine/threonine-protein kinase n=1 Tax=Escallonia rubra TaxID=112253 RepID=A0AA88RH85_9ASTE|nr:LOW QUALITY PROTEIN: hypothetical protein RJ640_017550 [Escallonia rubra]